MMDAVIVCGGRGTRLFPDTASLPKVLLPIGGHTVLDLLMSHLIRHGIHRIVLCVGYRASDIITHMRRRSTGPLVQRDDSSYTAHLSSPAGRPTEVVIVDSGLDTPTGARLHRVAPWLRSPEFLVAYGDVLGDVALPRLLAHHREAGVRGTITTAEVRSPFGHVKSVKGGLVLKFDEKPVLADPVNIGFMVLDRDVSAELGPVSGQLEQDLLRRLASTGELSAYFHEGHFERMDTVADRRRLEEMWHSGELAWLDCAETRVVTAK